jgi:probable HAF family extracellular repeat protein
MKFSPFCIALLILLPASTLAVAQAKQHAFYWSQATGMIDIGTLGGSYSFATAINESGTVVGASATAGDASVQAFRWTLSGGMQPLDDFGSGSFANGINKQGQIVGYAGATGGNHAVLWSNIGTVQDLGTLGGPTSWATGINDKGVITGDSYAPSPYGIVAFVWTSTHGMQTFGIPKSDGNGIGKQIAGDFVTRGVVYHAFVWDKVSGRQDLGNLAGVQDADSFAWAINLAGQVVGQSAITKQGPAHAFLWTSATGMTDLGSLGSNSFAFAISRNGQTAGVSYIPGDAFYHAVIWQNGSIVDLGTLGGLNSGASGINSSGEVAGSSDVP